mgnify:FL=1
MLDNILQHIDNLIDRLMKVLDYVLPIWFALIFISLIYQMVTR